MSTKMTAVDIFNALSTKEKQKALAILRKSEPTPCQRLGHKFKPFTIETGWFTPPIRKLVCERCGQSKEIA